MVKLKLSIKADLENVTDLTPMSDDFDWVFKVKCNSCNEEHPKEVTINKTQERNTTIGKPTPAHFVWKCSNCKRESSAKFEPGSTFTAYTADNSGQFSSILVIECRGLEFTGFNPEGLWKCKGTDSNTPFTDIDLGEKEWTDYDEKAGNPVSIMEIESRWDRA